MGPSTLDAVAERHFFDSAQLFRFIPDINVRLVDMGSGAGFPGLVIASVFYSMPFVVQPIQNAFEAMGERPMEVAASLRASPRDAFFSVALPLARPGFVTAAILGFAHTVGEFGVVLMIGGNIPDKTRVVSVQIYDHVEAMEYAQAHWLAGGMVVFSFLVLLALYGRRKQGGWSK